MTTFTPNSKALQLIGIFNKFCRVYPDKMGNSIDAALSCAYQIMQAVPDNEKEYWRQVRRELKTMMR